MRLSVSEMVFWYSSVHGEASSMKLYVKYLFFQLTGIHILMLSIGVDYYSLVLDCSLALNNYSVVLNNYYLVALSNNMIIHSVTVVWKMYFFLLSRFLFSYVNRKIEN